MTDGKGTPVSTGAIDRLPDDGGIRTFVQTAGFFATAIEDRMRLFRHPMRDRLDNPGIHLNGRFALG
jgi:hypothetical protein